MSCALDPNENLEKAKWRIREAAAGGAQIVCLQELFRSQYFCREENAELFALAEPIPGPTTETLGSLARELGIVIIASLFERRGAGLYHNTAAVIGTDGEIAGIYRKMHIPDDPLYFEKFYFTPGDLGFLNFDTAFARVGVLVCWDQWYPEAARAYEHRRREHSFLSDGHRLASGGKAAIRRRPIGCLANHPARPRHRERNLCGRGESRGLRRAAGPRSRILGIFLRGRSIRPGDRRSASTARKTF